MASVLIAKSDALSIPFESSVRPDLTSVYHLKPCDWLINFMDELLLTVVVYELLLLLLVTNSIFYLVAPKGAFCFSGCPVYRGL